MDLRFPFSPAEVAKVRTVQFGILSPDEIVNFAFSTLLFLYGFFLISYLFYYQEMIRKMRRKAVKELYNLRIELATTKLLLRFRTFVIGKL